MYLESITILILGEINKNKLTNSIYKYHECNIRKSEKDGIYEWYGFK